MCTASLCAVLRNRVADCAHLHMPLQAQCSPSFLPASWPLCVRISCRMRCTGCQGLTDPCATEESQRGSCSPGSGTFCGACLAAAVGQVLVCSQALLCFHVPHCRAGPVVAAGAAASHPCTQDRHACVRHPGFRPVSQCGIVLSVAEAVAAFGLMIPTLTQALVPQHQTVSTS